MKSNDLVININYVRQKSDNQSLVGKSISRQISLNATPLSINSSLSSMKQQPEIRAYKRRFLMIALSLLLCIINAFQWIQFADVTDKMTLYYDITNLQVNLLSIIYFCVYVTCIVPATNLIERKGLRYSIIVGAILNFLGALIKCASVDPEYGFEIVMLGQFFCGSACLLIFNIPPEIASTWFKSEEVSRVVSLLVCSCFIGNALAFFVPTHIVGTLKTASEIANGFYSLYFGVMLISALILGLIIMLFQERPTLAPSLSQFYRLKAIKSCEVNETTSITDLLQNLFQMILIEFPGDNSKVGSLGLVFVLSGMLGSLFCGYLLDKMHKYKETSVIFYGGSIFFLILFMFKLHFSSTTMINLLHEDLVKCQTVSNNILFDNILLHVYVFGLGFFLIGYWTIRFDFGPELAYPNPASTVCGLTAACCDVAGIIISLITSKIVDGYGTLASNLVLVALLSAGMCLLCTLKPEYKRQAANSSKPLTNTSNYNNQITHTTYGSLDIKWSEHRGSLIQASFPCKAKYTNFCFKFPSSNAVLAN